MFAIKKTLIFALLFLAAGELFATHIVGGGMTYECLGNSGNGKLYRFTMKVYVDCINGQVSFDDPANIAIYRGTEQSNTLFDDFQISLASFQDITVNEPDCIGNLPEICVQEGVYTWESVLPVSNQSYFIVYQRCCRTNAIANIIDPGGSGTTYSVEITPLAQTLCNNSPVFNNFPPVLICNNYPLEVDYSVTDADGDLLVYSFCAPYLGGGNIGGGCNSPLPSPPCPPPFDLAAFTTPLYTAGAPMAGDPVVQINPATGVISGTPQMNGQFVVGVCVEEYRNGQLLSVTRRDFQFNVTPCAPQVTALVDYDELAGPSQYVIRKCDGTTTVTINNESLPLANIQTFEWIFDLNGTILTNSTDFDITVNFPDFGVYNGILVLNEGLDCGDTAFIKVELYEPASLDLGPDILVCDDSTIVLDAGTGFVSYQWQDGSTGQTFSATTTGLYELAATDACGNVLNDAVQITLSQIPELQLPDLSLCPGESTTVSVPGFVQYTWTPAGGLSCTDCGTVTIQPTASTSYSVAAVNQDGCATQGSFDVTVLPTPMVTRVIQFYSNQSVTLGGQTYTQSGTVVLTVPSTTGGCDSLNTYILELIPTTLDLQCPANLTVALPNNASNVPVNYAQPTATTDCPGAPPTITLTQGLASGGNFPPGLTTVCFEANNTCNNVDNCCFTVLVSTLDLVCPPNLTVALPNNAATVPVNYAQPTVTTNCPDGTPAIQLTQGLASGGNFAAGVNTICYEATNTCGNSKSCCFTATVTTLSIQCPANVTVQLPVAATTVPVNYNAPTTATNCPGAAPTVSLLQGQPSGGAFGLGLNQVCYQASNTCGNQTSCCFNVTVLQSAAPCDIKNIGCMKYELLDIRLDSIDQPRFRIRVTNFCASELDYAMIELPPGVVGVTPVNGSIYTAPNTGNQYLVRNPNASPFYSTRYRSVGTGINNGQADVLEQRLPQQSFPNNYIHMNAKLKNGQSFEAYLNTFYCPVQPWAGSKLEEGFEREEMDAERSTFSIRPNPTDGVLYVDLSEWLGHSAQVQVLNAQGQLVLNRRYEAGNEWLEINLDGTLANGLYYLVVHPEGGEKVATKFVLER
ncbi:MAG: HYR domain-containing protein [Lewinellaceae bacterium]|nr:HYR domain-containing protein [Lewinellaceae bacterium]